jgi:hypothetical protein
MGLSFLALPRAGEETTNDDKTPRQRARRIALALDGKLPAWSACAGLRSRSTANSRPGNDEGPGTLGSPALA